MAGLDDPSPEVRATALGAMARLGRLSAEQLGRGWSDPDARVRARACELAAGSGPGNAARLARSLADPSDTVVEAACFALGELGEAAVGEEETGNEVLARLVEVASTHTDAVCREAAVAALGAIRDRRGLEAILSAAANDKAGVRRRAVLALAPFDGPEVDAALERAASDRDWQVRQASEDLTSP